MKKFECTECGKTCYSATTQGKCPHCGGKLVQVKGKKDGDKQET